jgi:hypothetical protein
MKQGFIICRTYEEIEYPVVFTNLEEAEAKKDNLKETDPEHYGNLVIRTVNIK